MIVLLYLQFFKNFAVFLIIIVEMVINCNFPNCIHSLREDLIFVDVHLTTTKELKLCTVLSNALDYTTCVC